MRKIIYIVSRDFNQWTNQLIKEMYGGSIKKLLGKGLVEQMVNFTGRTFVWYRYEDENLKLKENLLNLSSDHKIFQEDTHENFIQGLTEFRNLIQFNMGDIQDTKEHYLRVKEKFLEVYPMYPVALFLTGIWRNEFRHREKLSMLDKSRHHSEGFQKENDNYMRKWLGPKLEEIGIPGNFLKLMSVEEIDDFVLKGNKPDLTVLEERSNGFFYMDDKIYPTTDLKGFLSSKGLFLENENEIGFVKGRSVFECGVIKGKVKVVMNSEEVQKIQKGDIMVTPMTAPDLSCHIAIVAREMGKPAVMGTKVATKVLRDGDIVEIDTKTGEVKKL